MTSGALFRFGAVTLHSGEESNWKVECDALTEEDWRTLAVMAQPLVGPAYDVIGVPRGGLPFAEALKAVLRQSDDAPVLVVDDVLTSGGSIREVMTQYPGSRGLVAFARGPLPPNVQAVWHRAQPQESALRIAHRRGTSVGTLTARTGVTCTAVTAARV